MTLLKESQAGVTQLNGDRAGIFPESSSQEAPPCSPSQRFLILLLFYKFPTHFTNVPLSRLGGYRIEKDSCTCYSCYCQKNLSITNQSNYSGGLVTVSSCIAMLMV